MSSRKYIKKYIIPPVLATTVLLSPVFTTSVSASSFYTVGDTGSSISSLQEDLGDHGYHTAVDGIYGPNTRSTVISFQKDRSNLQVDGIAGKNTLAALGMDNGATSDAGSQSSAAYYTYGDVGSGVQDVQSDLSRHGFNTSVDGIYGSNTRSTVRSFQRAKGLQVDGIAGKNTLAALDNKPSGNTSSNAGSQQGSDVVSTAQQLIGTPYVFGGTTPSGFDSSGFINYAFEQNGVNLSRTHAGMWANNGVKVSNPEPGDVVFYKNTYKSGISHSGIYIGNDKMIHAGTSSTGVEVTNMNYDYWQSRYVGAKTF